MAEFLGALTVRLQKQRKSEQGSQASEARWDRPKASVIADCAGIPSGAEDGGLDRCGWWVRDGREAQASAGRQEGLGSGDRLRGRRASKALSGRDHQARWRRWGRQALSPAARSVWRGTTRVVQAAAPASPRTPSPRTRPQAASIPFPLRAPHPRIERRWCLERKGRARSGARHAGTCSLGAEARPRLGPRLVSSSWAEILSNSQGEDRTWLLSFWRWTERSLSARNKKHWPQGNCSKPVFHCWEYSWNCAKLFFFSFYCIFSKNFLNTQWFSLFKWKIGP